MENEITPVKTNNATQLQMDGEFTLRFGEKIKQDLISSASEEGIQSLDLTHASAMDVAGIQLAFAWKRALQDNGKKAQVILPESENIKDLFAKTGITQIL
jgi:anti-anti-sigma regulatory factor